MKNNIFKINVGDLLQSAGKIDEFSFKNEQLDTINGLSKNGISSDVTIQSFDKNALLLTLKNITATIIENCDICQTQYSRKLNIDEYSAKFQKEINLNDTTDDDVFQIDGNENIDIKDMITQAIILQEPLSKKCPICTKKSSKEIDDFDNNEYLEGTGNITFS